MPDPIDSHTLRSGDTEITVLSMGCAVQNWLVTGRPVTLGFADPEAYRTNPSCMGAICGRVINRLSNAQFSLNGETWHLPANLGPHHLHGGPKGFAWQNWQMEEKTPKSVTLTLHSPHLDQGYPGAVDMRVTLTLDGFRLTYDISGHPDRETILNIGQHLYFNLAGDGLARNHRLQIDADRCTPTDDVGLPTGAFFDVIGSRFDFRVARDLTGSDADTTGFDLNFALRDRPDRADPSAAARMSVDDMQMILWTDRPGLQLYTANGLGKDAQPLPGGLHAPFGAVCLEAQDFPDAPNQPGFGSIVCSPDRPYRQRTSIEIAPVT